MYRFRVTIIKYLLLTFIKCKSSTVIYNDVSLDTDIFEELLNILITICVFKDLYNRIGKESSYKKFHYKTNLECSK